MSPTFVDYVRETRAELQEVIDLLGPVDDAYVARMHVIDARHCLGLLLDHVKYMNNPYEKAHNLRRLHGENYRVYDERLAFPNDYPLDLVPMLESVRQRLQQLADKIFSRLYLAAADIQLLHAVDLVSRAWQETLLARCWVSRQLGSMTFIELSDSNG